MRQIDISSETWPIEGVFRLSRGASTEVDVVVVTVVEGDSQGRGEAVPYRRYGESVATVIASMQEVVPELIQGMERKELQQTLPPGAARNALDCALWDLEARRSGRPVWELAGLSPPQPLETAFTISLDTPEIMREKARQSAARPLLKLKLGSGDHEEDLARLRAVRDGAPRARLIVDVNEGWTVEDYTQLIPELVWLGVEMIEQPLSAASDEALTELPRPITLCADESCHDRSSLSELIGRYDMVNIKLDKAGGLTEALELRREAQANDLMIMVGCMVSTSLAVAPATFLAQGASVVDLDGAFLLARDRKGGLRYHKNGLVEPPAPTFWGG